MDKLRAMQTFVKIVEAGSLTAAAHVLELSQPAVVRQLAALERALETRLINRTTRRMSLTDEGREYCDHARAVLAAVDEAEQAVASRRSTPRGRLRISAPVGFGRLHLAPVVLAFLSRHPEMKIELVLVDRIVDLVEEGIDLAIRIAHMPDSSLVARQLGHTRRVVAGSPALARRTGRPQLPAELSKMPCVAFTGLGAARDWSFEADGARIDVPIAPIFIANQIDVALQACVAGIGWGRFLSYQIQTAVDAGQLVQVLSAFDSAPVPVQIVYPHARLVSSGVRAFVEFAVPELKAQLEGAPRAPATGPAGPRRRAAKTQAR